MLLKKTSQNYADFRQKSILKLNNRQKHSFIGILLSPGSSMDSGIAYLNRDRELLKLDKFYKLEDLEISLKNNTDLESSVIFISIPEDYSLIDSKWKLNAKKTVLFNINEQKKVKEKWLNRYSNRGTELIRELKEMNCDIYRFDIKYLKMAFGLNTIFTNRSIHNCRCLQYMLKDKFGFTSLSKNMLPIAQLEALLGAFASYLIFQEKYNYKVLFNFNNIPVISI